MQYLKTLEIPEEYNRKQRKDLIRQSKQYLIKNDILYKQSRKGLPQRVIWEDYMKEIILFNFHTGMLGVHMGIQTVFEKLKERYYWKDVKEYIKTCDICQKRESRNRIE